MNKKFTISGVFFSVTGSVPILKNASKEYKEKAVKEIKNDLVYNYILSDIPVTDRFNDELFPDYDPVIRQFVCANSLEMKQLLLRYTKRSKEDKIPLITEEIYIELPKITLEEYKKYLKVANRKVKRQNDKEKDKSAKKKILKKEKIRLNRDDN
ncbi:MAG: hypothetical protein IKN87_02000 [Bacilli bacterium]|nr:hypothetical protein [Bacilli bacterium]